MKKVLLGLFTILLATFGFGGISMADTTVTHHTENVVPGTYTLNGNTGFTAGTITVTAGTTTITILDRNLGATAAGTGCEDINYELYHPKCSGIDNTYGYLFQWGNNYGFPSHGELSNMSSTLVPSPINIPYSSSTFITGHNNWMNDDSVVNLWGGTTNEGSYDANNRQITNAQERQGPCPDGFHVPSAGELYKLFSMFNYDASDIHENLKIPYAGRRQPSDEMLSAGALREQGYRAGLLSSSINSNSPSNYSYGSMIIYTDTAFINNDSRSTAQSVRCFYNNYAEYGVTTPTEISSISITGITLPVGGATPTLVGIESQTDGVSVVQSRPFDGGITAMIWFDVASGHVQNDSSFVSGKVYRLYMPLVVANGYTLTSGYTGSFGNYNATVDYNTNQLVFEFTATAPAAYTIRWLNYNGDALETDENVAEGTTPTYDGATPTKPEDSSYTYTFDKWTPDVAPATGNATYTATFTCTAKQSSSSPSTSSGGKTVKKNTTNTDTDKTTEKEDTDNDVPLAIENNSDTPIYEQGDQSEVLDNGYTREFNNAYRFGLKYGITTMDDINKADMHGPLTRIAMDKMLVNYAINVLHMVPDTTREVPNFPDVDEKLNEEYGNAVTLGYQLGIMGINIEEFRPFDEVPRADFGTSLGRMLFGLVDGEGLYYEPHLKMLKERGIITNDDPNLQELRGYVMLMLMRSAM